MEKVLAWLATLVAASTAAAQVQVDRLFPPGVGPGESVVTAEGKLPTWPCQIFCDRDDIQFTPDEAAGRWKITVPQDVSPGVAWIRLFDQQHASNLVPLMIESIPVATESKPADGVASDASPVALPAVIAGRLAKSGEVDAVRVSLKAGEALVGSLIANQILQSPMDAVLQIADLDGNVLAQAEDVRGLDPQLVFRSTEDLEGVIRIFAFPATPNSTVGFSGSSSHTYLLRLTTGPFLDHVLPIAVGAETDVATAAGWNLPDDPVLVLRRPTSISPQLCYLASGLGWHWRRSLDPRATNVLEAKDPNAFAQVDQLPAVFCGRISEARQVDRLRFQVSKGKKYTARSYSKADGFLLDTVLRVIDVKSGAELAEKDDLSRTDFDAVVEFQAKEDAIYELQVIDAVQAFGIRHVYAVRLEEAQPGLSLSLAADQFTLPAGGSLEIPVTVTRTSGYAEKLRVAATGLPDGVTASEVVSEAKGETAKAVKLKLSAEKNVIFQGSIQIVGTELDADGKPTATTRTATFPLRPGIELREIWLTVPGKMPKS